MKKPCSFTFNSLSVLAAFGVAFVPQVKAAEPAPPTAPAPTSPTLVPPSSLMRSGGVMQTTLAPPTAQEALNYLKLDKVKRICAQPIALKVDNASADTVAAQVRRLLATAKIPLKIPVEVRQVKAISLTFNSKKSSISKVLSSTAQLGAAQLWIFSDHLLLAPAESLTPAEEEAQNKGFGFNGSSSDRSTPALKSWAYSSFIANELKDLKPNTNTNADILKARSQQSVRSIGPLLSNATFGQLSPDAQAMLQELLDMTGGRMSSNTNLPSFSNLAFSTNTPIEIVGGSGENSGRSQLEIFLAGNKSEWVLSWGLAGGSSSIRGSIGRPDTPTNHSKPGGAPPLDLSAGKA